MKKPFSGSRLGAATVLTAVALIGGGLAMAPTASASTDAAASAPASATGSKVTPDANGPGCVAELFNWGEYTRGRAFICNGAAVASLGNQVTAMNGCVAGMLATGLQGALVARACTIAVYG